MQESTNAPKWSLLDFFKWKSISEEHGGGFTQVYKYKNSWIVHNSHNIKSAAKKAQIPADVLACIAWIEVGGTPDNFKPFLLGVRQEAYPIAEWLGVQLPGIKPPLRTSVGPVAIQLRRAAAVSGLSPESLSHGQIHLLTVCLQIDLCNLELAAEHIREIIKIDYPNSNTNELSDEQIRIVGTRYNRGIELPLSEIKKDTDYGDKMLRIRFLVKNLLEQSPV